jgi:uncharacterized membrane protein YbhN (UPF0104 family)
MDRSAKFLIKCAVTALLFWLIAQRVDLADMFALFRKAQPFWLAASLGLVLAITVLDALAFCSVMRIFGHKVRLAPSFLYSLVGWFFSNLAPSTLGGDIFRTVQMQRLGAPLGTAVRSVLAARLMSFAALVPVIVLGLPIALNLIGDTVERLTLILIAGAGVAALLLAYTGFRLAPWFAQFSGNRLSGRLLTLAEDFRRVNHSGIDTLSCWLFAAAQHIVRVAVLAALAASLQLGIPFPTLFALTPAALLVAMVPISLGSWGLREAAFVVFLGGAGITSEAALSLSIIFGLQRVVMGGLGGLAWLAADHRHYKIELDVGTGNPNDATSNTDAADEAHTPPLG